MLILLDDRYGFIPGNFSADAALQGHPGHAADGQAVARVGDWIVLGGGETDLTEFIEDIIGQSLPPDCTGPYWITGTIIE